MGTRDYSTDVVLVKKALSQMESLVSAYNGYALSEPVSRFGWTFFKIAVRADLQEGIERRFSEMISRYRWAKTEEKFARFMNDYLRARGCQVEVKLVKN